MNLINSSYGLDRLVQRYRTHLENTAGLRPGTCAYYTKFTREFLSVQSASGKKPLPMGRLNTPRMVEYLVDYGRRYSLGQLQRLSSVLRSFFRFLVLTGRCSPAQVPLLPAVRTSGRPSLPEYLTQPELARLLKMFDRRTKQGLRDYTWMLCLARLGLRTGELIGLTLDDLDWRQATLCLRQTKARRERILPLTAEIGRALADYLRRVRPPTVCRELFVDCNGQKPLGAFQVITLTRKAFARAHLERRRAGPQLLRRTVASHLIQGGAPLKAIADLLGHQHLNTTTRYAQVNLPMLAKVLQPWPGEVA